MSIPRRHPIRYFYETVLLSAFLFVLVAVYTLEFPKAGFQQQSLEEEKGGNLTGQRNGNPNASPIEQIATSEFDVPSPTYSRVFVIARTKEEDVSWVERELAGVPDLQTAVYTVDESSSSNHGLENKGSEVIVYLTYIIDNHHNLSDITIFMHSHPTSCYDNDLFENNASMIKRLSGPKIMREGYMNMRCHLPPGYPPNFNSFSPTPSHKIYDSEETIFTDAWRKIFPGTQVPALPSQPCSSTFAVSKAKIQTIPRETYIHYRDSLLKSKSPNSLSSNVWGSIWHVLFTGVDEVYPKEHICYCDGYGVCFGGEREYGYFRRLQDKKMTVEKERDEFRKETHRYGVHGLAMYERMIEELDDEMGRLKKRALDNGMDAEFRAMEVGRTWRAGDGY